MAAFSYADNTFTQIVDGQRAQMAINAIGPSGGITDMRVRLGGLAAGVADDLNFLLVAPNNTNNLMLMGDAGGNSILFGKNLLFANSVNNALPDNTDLTDLFYDPTVHGAQTKADFGWVSGAQMNIAGPINVGTTTLRGAFDGIDADGTWTLYALDDLVNGFGGAVSSFQLMIETDSSTAEFDGTAGFDDFFVNAAGNQVSGNLGVVTMAGVSTVIFHGGASADQAIGGAEDDIFYGEQGNDLVEGGAGNDILYGGVGDDILSGREGDDLLNGGEGNDSYSLLDGTDAVFDSDGIDTISSTVSRSLELYPNIESLTLIGSGPTDGTGNAFANTIRGTFFDNVINGIGGFDTFEGLNGNDIYYVDRTIDTVVEASGAVAGLTDRVIFTGVKGQTYVMAANVEQLVLAGTAATRSIGTAGANIMTGNAAANTLNGGAGADTLRGVNGNDLLAGGLGKDIITGGLGNDRFSFLSRLDAKTGAAGMDVILDFDDRSDDRIDLARVFGPRLSFIGDDAFTKGGQVRIKDIAGPDVIVEVNLGGSLLADMQIRLVKTTFASMTASDFVL